MSVGTHLLNFVYDASGSPMVLTYDGTAYYYATNLQGDIVAILDSAGTAVVQYTYDAWGKPLSTTGTMATTLGVHNPLRYRGYVYDEEFGLYYLQSRYYDPQLGRFINADAFASTGQGLLGNNMFAYCNNNPIAYVDSSGFSLSATTVRIDDGGSGCIRFSPPIPIPVDPTTILDTFSGIEDKVDELKEAITNSFARAKKPNDNSQTEDHHIVAQKASKAAPARTILEEVIPYGVENPMNHIIINKGLHKRLHRNIYYEDIVNTVIISAYQAAGGNKTQAAQNVSIALGVLAGVIKSLDAIAPY